MISRMKKQKSVSPYIDRLEKASFEGCGAVLAFRKIALHKSTVACDVFIPHIKKHLDSSKCVDVVRQLYISYTEASRRPTLSGPSHSPYIKHSLQ